MTWKIIADSGCDYRQLPTPAINTTFVSVPLTIQVADQVFVDDASLDIDQMMETMYANCRSFKIGLSKPR
ncbi:fatty-acid binding protein [Streptococcus pneumoniae]|nr:fatty-acid binding protein [Streptococcus pneumoniae]